jgi:hypothetical protein
MGLVDHTIAGGIISFQPPGIVNGKFRVEFKTWSWVYINQILFLNLSMVSDKKSQSKKYKVQSTRTNYICVKD